MEKKTIRQNVESLMRDYPETRNSDKVLILKYWELIDEIPMNSITDFRNAFILHSTSTESIRRARQLVQEEGKYLPTDDMVVQRRSKKRKMERKILTQREVV